MIEDQTLSQAPPAKEGLDYALINSERIKCGIQALINGRSIQFEKTNSNLVVVFDLHPSIFASSNILLFQQYVLSKMGELPVVVKQIPACIKVFFTLRRLPSQAEIVSHFKSAEFGELSRDLQINYVQIGAEAVWPMKP